MSTLISRSCLLSVVISLSACGGSTGMMSSEPAKTPAPIATNEFVSLAKNANCADYKNRLFLIDQQYVLWDKSGHCADASYAQFLYGSTPSVALCSNVDSIAGPRTSCNDKNIESLFKTMIQNLEKADLGLGTGHQVQSIAIPENTRQMISFKVLPAPFYHGVTLDFVLIKDKQAWDGFWNVSGGTSSPNLVSPDFGTKMVLAKFYKTANDCSITRFLKVSSDGQKLHVNYMDEERISINRCDPSHQGTNTPMQMIELPKIDLAVELHSMNNALIPYNTTASGMMSAISTARSIVIRDQANWKQLWQEHQANTSGSSTPPAVDFSKKMLVAVFLGNQSSGCSGIQELRVWRDAGKILVTHYDVVPGPASICTANMTSPFHIAEVDLSMDQVEFISAQATTP